MGVADTDSDMIWKCTWKKTHKKHVAYVAIKRVAKSGNAINVPHIASMQIAQKKYVVIEMFRHSQMRQGSKNNQSNQTFKILFRPRIGADIWHVLFFVMFCHRHRFPFQLFNLRSDFHLQKMVPIAMDAHSNQMRSSSVSFCLNFK